jgi:hypothetical protein
MFQEDSAIRQKTIEELRKTSQKPVSAQMPL